WPPALAAAALSHAPRRGPGAPQAPSEASLPWTAPQAAWASRRERGACDHAAPTVTRKREHPQMPKWKPTMRARRELLRRSWRGSSAHLVTHRVGQQRPPRRWPPHAGRRLNAAREERANIHLAVVTTTRALRKNASVMLSGKGSYVIVSRRSRTNGTPN